MHEIDLNAAAPRAGIDDWWRASLRSAVFGRPRWPAERASPGLVAALVLVTLMLEVAAHRLYVDGPARFYWPALAAGWLPTALAAWICWRLAPQADAPDALAGRAPSGSALFALYAAQALVLTVAVNAVWLAGLRSGLVSDGSSGSAWAWGPTLALVAWNLGAQVLLLWRGGHGSARVRGACVVLLAAVGAAAWWSDPLRLWYPDEERSAKATAEPPFQLTPALIEAQGLVLATRLEALEPERPGVTDVYALTFAPYADEDVFLRESRLVAGVMAERFGADGRALQLVNHRHTVAEWPWATPENLERALHGVARRMNRDEDLLFIHLTSHGARSGQLAARFWPLDVEALTPERLKTALDHAGVRHRVISVSACYSGSWIAPLADENTLVMTASDADHTSFGCGRGSELTYFGRALFDESLRQSWSFESALATARGVIERREKEAGKSDGFSNPQIHVGSAIRERLKRLEQQQAAAAK